jgi:hypothetical protein
VDYHRRGRLLDEAIDAVRAAFGPAYVSFDGQAWAFTDVGIGPQPPQGQLPVWIGGSGPAAWSRVGRRGDGYIPMGNPLEQLPDIIATIRREADESGRGDHHFDVGFHPGLIHIGTPPSLDDGVPLVTGSPEQVCENLRRATAAGANVLHVRFFNRSLPELLDQMEAFGRDVAPGLV